MEIYRSSWHLEQENNIFSIKQETELQRHKSSPVFSGCKMFLSACESAAEQRCWTLFLIAVAKKAAPRVTTAGGFYTSDAHCALAWSLNSVSKHKEHISILFSAQCGFCTSIKLPQSWGPKHFKTTSTP